MSSPPRPSHRYSTDLTDEQWAILEPLFPAPDPTKGGRPRQVALREIVNAIFYIEKTGCQWRLLPTDFPHWGLVWQYFRYGNTSDAGGTRGHGKESALP